RRPPRTPTTPRFPYTTLFRSRNLFRHLLQPLPREAGGALGRRQATPGRNDHVGRNLFRQQALSPSERAQESKSNARGKRSGDRRSEEHTSELQSRENLVCRLL